jgi:hypothetical protein
MNEDLLSGPDPGADELRAIVSRASKRRWRTVGAAAAVALAAGGGIGYGVSNHSGRPQTVVAGSSTSGTTVYPNGASMPLNYSGQGSTSVGAAMPAMPLRYTRLFVRDAGTVTIRGYLAGGPAGVPPTCFAFPRFQAEVSTRYAIGQASGGGFPPSSASTEPVRSAEAELIGVIEQDPVYVVVVNTSPQVAQVKMTFVHGGSDQMAPVQSWAALADELPAADLPADSQFTGAVGTLQALGSSGQVLQTMTVDMGMNPVPQGIPNCVGACPPIQPGATGSKGGAGSSTGAQSRSATVSPSYACAGVPATRPPASLPAQTVPGGIGSATTAMVPTPAQGG